MPVSSSERVVDEAALRVLRIVERAARTPKGGTFDEEAHHALARRVAAQGIVLLKNDGVLPLSDAGNVAVIGRAAMHPQIQGRGSSQITPTRIDSPLDELASLLGGGRVRYAAGYDEVQSDRADLIARAVAIAAAADVAVVFVTLPDSKETEGRDRTDLEIGDQQVALIEAVAAVQPRTVVVLFNGSAVSLSPWVDRVAAVVEAWYAGQAAGGAVADVLTGAVNPSGRLAETFPVRLEDTPAYLDFPGDRDTVRHGEGIFVGYRWYDARRLDVQFPFGHGLSYTTFGYRDAEASMTTIDPGRGTTVRVTVSNTGDRAGSDVVQVYARETTDSHVGPEKALCGFAKVQLEPGESRTVEVEVDARAFSSWDPAVHRWVCRPASFDLLIARSAADVVATLSVSVTGERERPSTLTDMSPLRDWLEDETARDLASVALRDIAPILGATFGEWPEDGKGPAMHFDDYFGAMPLRGVLEFAAASGGPDPDARLALLLDGLAAPPEDRRSDQPRPVETVATSGA